MRNYLSYATEWRTVKDAVAAEHKRLEPLITAIISEHHNLSGQRVPAHYMDVCEHLAFSPFWGGWAYKFSEGWWSNPEQDNHWSISLKEAKEVLAFLTSLTGEEEVKLLFRRWTEELV